MLSFVDPTAKIFAEDFSPDNQGGNVLARLVAELNETPGGISVPGFLEDETTVRWAFHLQIPQCYPPDVDRTGNAL